jgi:hypothetical protein
MKTKGNSIGLASGRFGLTLFAGAFGSGISGSAQCCPAAAFASGLPKHLGDDGLVVDGQGERRN